MGEAEKEWERNKIGPTMIAVGAGPCSLRRCACLEVSTIDVRRGTIPGWGRQCPRDVESRSDCFLVNPLMTCWYLHLLPTPWKDTRLSMDRQE